MALAPILSKILEWCILIQFNDYFVTSPLQFGLKKSMSSYHSLHGLSQAVYYMTLGSSVYSCLLDASKAFDLIDHFHLLSHGMVPFPPLLVYLMVFIKEVFIKEVFCLQFYSQCTWIFY